MSDKKICEICPHHCRLDVGEIGKCRARKNFGDKIFPINYGELTSLALDPIEKKPLYHFFPKSFILSAGSYGCNLNCPFCQNFEISMADSNFPTKKFSPEELVNLAVQLVPKKNIGIAFTYNEPIISYEFIFDTSKLLKKFNLKSVLVTNGNISSHALEKILPFIDAMNIDLKGFSQKIYDELGGDFETVKNTIKISAKSCHVEVTSLIVPQMNDSENEMLQEAEWLAGISENIPLHVSRFFPRYKILNRPPTDIKKIYELAENARKFLKYVYVGNC
ncbi:MAG: AmmeMemoRadiSam system radical SAM enzyme [Selenomonadaceae bacterium]|nr:AmmeMemoRadiSam system radical SAM enzyme [Selenomonadaceae bacterium]